MNDEDMAKPEAAPPQSGTASSPKPDERASRGLKSLSHWFAGKDLGRGLRRLATALSLVYFAGLATLLVQDAMAGRRACPLPEAIEGPATLPRSRPYDKFLDLQLGGDRGICQHQLDLLDAQDGVADAANAGDPVAWMHQRQARVRRCVELRQANALRDAAREQTEFFIDEQRRYEKELSEATARRGNPLVYAKCIWSAGDLTSLLAQGLGFYAAFAAALALMVWVARGFRGRTD